MPRLLTLLLILSFCTCVRAQKQSVADLRQVIDTTESAVARLDLYSLIYDRVRRDTTVAGGVIDTMRQLNEAANSDYATGVYYRYLTRYLDQKGEFEAGRTAIQKSIEAYSRIGAYKQLAISYINYAMLFRAESNYAEIFRHAEKSLEYARKVDANEQIGIAYNTMGIAQRNIGNLEAAGRYYNAATKYFIEGNNVRALFSIYYNMGAIQSDKQNYDSAAYYTLKALEISEQQKPVNEFQVGIVHANLSSYYVKSKQKSMATASARKAYALLKRVGGPEERSAASLNLAQALMAQGQADKTLTYLDETRKTITEFGPWRSEDNLFRAYGKYYAAVGNIDSVDHYFDKFSNAVRRNADSLRVGEVARLEAGFQNREKQAEIDRLALEDELNQVRLRRQQWIIGGGLIVVGLLGSLLWWIYTQRQRIGVQNELITQALEDKDTLLKEIHHRVKNNLQMVSTLLSLQSDYVEDSVALDALQMGRSRVRSMALIHQKLYVGETVSTLVDAKDYLERLVREVVDTHRSPATLIEVITEMEELELDIDTIVPLGLIANEAVTNAVKYAYQDRAEGVLYVSFVKEADEYQLTVRDDGPGLAKKTTDDNGDSFGQLLMRTLSEQLEGKLTVKDTDDGAEVGLRFRAG